METGRVRVAVAVILGFIVMVLFAIMTVNILDFIPLAGPFFGGLAAGYIMGKTRSWPNHQVRSSAGWLQGTGRLI